MSIQTRRTAIRAWILALPLSILLLFSQARAVTISGKILDRETGESVPSAAVMVVGTQRGAAADVEGLFSIPDLTVEKVQLRISALGYQSLLQDVDFAGGVDTTYFYMAKNPNFHD